MSGKNKRMDSVTLINFIHSNGVRLTQDELEEALLVLDSTHEYEVHLDDFVHWYKEFMNLVILTNLLRANNGLPLLYHVPGII
jgi:prophage maintenance system killer protein